jgi:glutathione peroxidase
MAQSIYDFEVTTIDGKTKTLRDYRDFVMLIVNTASKCYFSKQFEELEEFYQKYKEKKFIILGFPCNQFGNQEPGSVSEIKQTCLINYKISFPIFQKILVNGENAHPLFEFLKQEQKGIFGTSSIKWNFTKFLINRDGKVVKRFGPKNGTSCIEKDLIAAL